MNRRDATNFLFALGVAPFAVEAQQTGKIYRLGTFNLARAPFTDPNSSFVHGLRDLGWVEGRNLVVERRLAATPERLPALAAELVRLNVDVIVVLSAGMASIAREATKTIPIVVLSAGVLEGTGLIATLARPGGNVTGMQIQNMDLMGKRIEILRELVPKLSRLSLLMPTTANGSVTIDYLSTIAGAGKALGVQIHHAPFRAINELEPAFATIVGNGSQAVLAISNPLTASALKEIVKLAEMKRLPVIYESSSYVSGNGLISYGANFPEVLKQAATFVDRLFRGAKAADLPVEQPTKFELVINLRTAKAIGLTVPQSLLLRADEVIR